MSCCGISTRHRAAIRSGAVPASLSERPGRGQWPAWSLVTSLLIHGVLLFVPRQEPPGGRQVLPNRLEARLAQRHPAAESALPAGRKPGKAPAKSRLLSAEKSRGPVVRGERQWTVAEKAEMEGFLDELDGQAPALSKPSLAQRSLAMAREQARQMAVPDAAGGLMLERRPNGPPADPFSLEMYMDGLLRRLNRSAAFVRNDPRGKGIRAAAVHFRLRPDGRLESFEVLYAGDQAAEIAFIREVVERSIPFSPFPPDIDKAARSLGVTICIQPGSGGGDLGFTRSGARAC